MTPLTDIRYPLILDGGLSNELERQGCDLNHKLWSARILDTNPDAIIAAHLAYLEAGARCITTASYQATIPGLMESGYEETKAESLILKSVELAQVAVHRFLQSASVDYTPIIAASVGPYGAYLADGSEYRVDYQITDDELLAFHQSRIALLDASNAACLACETIPSYQEMKILAQLIENSTKPAWMSFSCKDHTHINDGTPLVDCVKYLAHHPNLFAIGVNCTAPQYITSLMEQVHDHMGSMKFIVYPNSGEAYNAVTKTWSGISDPESFHSMAKEWLGLGAGIIGGCCRIGPDHIKTLNSLAP